MSGTPFSGGQLTKLRSHIDIAVTTALPNVADKFSDPKRVLKSFDGKGAKFAGHLEVALEQAIRAMFVLIPHKTISLTISALREPDTYYQTRSGLYVWDDFRPRIFAKAKMVAVGTTFYIDEYELSENLTDEEIENSLPKNHLFDESAVGAIVAEMVESGQLDKKYFYLLYADSCVVGVYWDSGSSKWDVGTYGRDGDSWYASDRVLSPAN